TPTASSFINLSALNLPAAFLKSNTSNTFRALQPNRGETMPTDSMIAASRIITTTWSSTLRKSLKKNRKSEAKKDQEAEEVVEVALSGWRLRRRWWRYSISSLSLRKLRIAELQIFQLIHRKIIDKFVFRVMYVAEAVVLVSTLCFFYVVCGGRL
ncbi:hypothetical protein LINGRAHAP2_LOCUS28253, partial [Linum grandiflorum]